VWQSKQNGFFIVPDLKSVHKNTKPRISFGVFHVRAVRAAYLVEESVFAVIGDLDSVFAFGFDAVFFALEEEDEECDFL
jgi:hypothetical protein